MSKTVFGAILILISVSCFIMALWIPEHYWPQSAGAFDPQPDAQPVAAASFVMLIPGGLFLSAGALLIRGG